MHSSVPYNVWTKQNELKKISLTEENGVNFEPVGHIVSFCRNAQEEELSSHQFALQRYSSQHSLDLRLHDHWPAQKRPRSEQPPQCQPWRSTEQALILPQSNSGGRIVPVWRAHEIKRDSLLANLEEVLEGLYINIWFLFPCFLLWNDAWDVRICESPRGTCLRPLYNL